jgi:hypothetical protein
MKKNIALYAIAAAALLAAPAAVRAQDTTTPPAENAPAKKHHALMFHGSVSAVDTTAMTLTVGTNTVNVTSKTKIMKDGKPAALTDITVGDMVHGAYKKADGKMEATVIHVGEMKKKKAE